MKALIYARVMPDNKRVARSDNLQSQEKRCRDFARKINASVMHIFRDEGAMNPPHLLRGINSLCHYLKLQKSEFLVISDHPARIGIKTEIRLMVMKEIEKSGGKFIAPHPGTILYVDSSGKEIFYTK